MTGYVCLILWFGLDFLFCANCGDITQWTDLGKAAFIGVGMVIGWLCGRLIALENLK